MSHRKNREDELEEPPKRILAEAEVPLEILALPRQFQSIIEALRAEFAAVASKAADSEMKLQKIIDDQDKKILSLSAEFVLLKDESQAKISDVSSTLQKVSNELSRFEAVASAELGRLGVRERAVHEEVGARLNGLSRMAKLASQDMNRIGDRLSKVEDTPTAGVTADLSFGPQLEAVSLEVKTLASSVDEIDKRVPAASARAAATRMELLEARVKASDSRVEIKRLAAALSTLEKRASVPPAVASSDPSLSTRVNLLESRIGTLDVSAKDLGTSAKIVQLESKVKKLEGLVLTSSSVPPNAPAVASASSRVVASSVRAPAPIPPVSSASVPVPGSEPVSTFPSGSAPKPSSYAAVLLRSRPMPITKAMMDAAADPLDLLLAKSDGASTKTKTIVALILSTKLEKAATIHPYLTWRAICKGATGRSPLSIIPITPEKVEVFWDASSEATLEAITVGLTKRGIVVEQEPLTESARGRRLRAYMSSYFVLLRQSALAGLADVDKAWVLDQVERRIRGFPDKDASKVWKKRVARDTLDFGLETLVQTGRSTQEEVATADDCPSVQAPGEEPDPDPDPDGMECAGGG